MKCCNRPGCARTANETGLCDQCQDEYIGESTKHRHGRFRRGGNPELRRYLNPPVFVEEDIGIGAQEPAGMQRAADHYGGDWDEYRHEGREIFRWVYRRNRGRI